MDKSVAELVAHDTDDPMLHEEDHDSLPITPASRRPEHSLLSIVLMLLLAAGAVYGVGWTMRPQQKVVHSWDFRSLPYESTPWRFPEVKIEQDEGGVIIPTLQTGPGPQLIMDLDTDTVNAVRATVEITRVEDGTPVGYALEWYWSSAEAVAAANGAWPYSTERGVAFRPQNRHTPNIHTAQVSRHKQWQGTIAQGFIGIKIPPRVEGPFFVRLVHVEFLE